MRRWTARAWAPLVLLLGCNPTTELPPSPNPPARTPDLAPPPVSVEVTSEPASEPRPPAPVVGGAPKSDELLLVRTTDCGPHDASDEHCEPKWSGLLRTLSDPRFVPCEVDPVGLTNPVSRQLVRGRIELHEVDEWHQHRCAVLEIRGTLAAHEHSVQPLDARHLGAVDLGLTLAEQGMKLRDLERGPLRVFVGLRSDRVRVASSYLHDLGPLLAISGRPLMTSDELRVKFDDHVANGRRIRWVGGAKKFAPQVGDRDERMAYAYTPVLLPGAFDGDNPHDLSHPWEHASAVPLRAADGRRYLVVSAHAMKDSWEAAERRGQMIKRIVEDDLHPFQAAESEAQ